MRFPHWITLLIACSLSAANIEERLKAYEGRWVGEFEISSLATGYKETYPVEQQYWIDFGVLRGIAVFVRQGVMVSSESMTFVNEGKLYSEITRDTGREVFQGLVREKWITWMPREVKEVADRQMKEYFVEEGGKRFLVTEGFDGIMVNGEKKFIVYKGRLEYKGPAAAPGEKPDK